MKFLTSITLPQLYAWIAPWATPIPSALFLAYHIYQQAPNDLIGFPAFVGSFIGFEAAGGICATAVVMLHTRKRYEGDFRVALIGLVFYVLTPWAVLNLSSNLAIPIYTALAAFAVFSANVWFQTGKEDRRIEEATKLELKRLRAAGRLQKMQNANLMQGDAKNVQNANLYTCQWCKTEFDNPRAFAAHGRWCEMKPKGVK